jgi:Fe-S-cluster containining protein
MKIPDDCRRCGVCCHSDSPTFVRVTGDDWTRLGDAADRLAHFLGHRAFLRLRDGHCAALEVRRTADGEPDFFCTIYERRPQVCRDLARGAPACAGEIAVKGAGVESRARP